MIHIERVLSIIFFLNSDKFSEEEETSILWPIFKKALIQGFDEEKKSILGEDITSVQISPKEEKSNKNCAI